MEKLPSNIVEQIGTLSFMGKWLGSVGEEGGGWKEVVSDKYG